jgi:hypothetical protein
MADNDRKQWNENKEPDRGDAAPDRNAQRGGHPGGYGPAQGEPVERSGTEQPKSSGREREH